jgi:hypothetical protein
MRFETLVARLAEKTNTPILTQVLQGEKSIQDLPLECMLWTGTVEGSLDKNRVRKFRDYNNISYARVSRDRPRPVIRWQKKKISVVRLLFQLVTKPDYEYRMLPLCGSPTCVNLRHWSASKIKSHQEFPEEIPEFETSSGWTIEEVEEQVENLLSWVTPASWEEIHHLLIQEDGAPEEMVKEVLEKLNRGHLLP